MKNELKAYYSEIENNLICERKQKNAFMAELKANIDEYLASEDEVDIEKIKAEFGTPEMIAASFLSGSDAAEIKKKMDVRKAVILAITVALVIYLAFVVISLIDVHTEAHGYMEEGIMMVSTLKGGGIL